MINVTVPVTAVILPVNLGCEYLSDPYGIGFPGPVVLKQNQIYLHCSQLLSGEIACRTGIVFGQTG
jgi:hypothetical protein